MKSPNLLFVFADQWRAQDTGYAEDATLVAHDDWRRPNAKELQEIVDYTRSPDTSNSPAIDPVFQTTSITNEAGQKDWLFFWTCMALGAVTPRLAQHFSHIDQNGDGYMKADEAEHTMPPARRGNR